jgi:hypothetical protein
MRKDISQITISCANVTEWNWLRSVDIGQDKEHSWVFLTANSHWVIVTAKRELAVMGGLVWLRSVQDQYGTLYGAIISVVKLWAQAGCN